MSNTINYNDFLSELQAQGLKTTYTSEKEADFSDYGNALSADLKAQIADSFDNERDYQMQAEIAGLYKGKGSNFMNSQSFISGCKGLGYDVKVQYVKTSYISDYKAGNFSNSVTNGAIAVYTISDGMGGEIKIADANGNGGLETEELFMNNILGDVMKDINIPTNSVSTSSSESSTEGNINILNTNNNQDKKITQEDFNTKVEKYLNRGFSKEMAIIKAKIELNIMSMNYTGSYNDESAA